MEEGAYTLKRLQRISMRGKTWAIFWNLTKKKNKLQKKRNKMMRASEKN